ncbi:MAG: hypothetical protein KAJ42_08585 [Gemmatimonadetes bacterium]|nr:hypothetical protein [Gemmatimonadota bacterium]
MIGALIRPPERSRPVPWRDGTGLDPIAFGGVVLLVVIVAVGAAALPAMRASKVDPRATLSAE